MCGGVYSLTLSPCTRCQEYVCGGVYSLTLPPVPAVRITCVVVCTLLPSPCTRCQNPHSRFLNLSRSPDPCTRCQDYVCGGVQRACSWGSAVAVGAAYVSVSQPRLQRVLVVSRRQQLVVDVVQTDKLPVQLHYVPHLDQVGSCDCTGGRWGLQV